MLGLDTLVSHSYGAGDVEVGGVVVPARRTDDGRLMRVRYPPPGLDIPKVSLQRLLDDPSLAAQFSRSGALPVLVTVR